MEESILKSVKKVVNVPVDYDAFDTDILMHINAAFSILTDIGIGDPDGYVVADDEAVWDDLGLPMNMTSMVRSYVYLKTRVLFDPPTMSFHLEAMKEQIAEFEVRLSIQRENRLATTEGS